MAISSAALDGDEETPMSDINTTPLVDVMLVLLIIFLIAVPVVLETVPVQLPGVAFEATVTKPENVNLSVKGDAAGNCEVYWNTTKMESADELLDRAVEKLTDEIEKLGALSCVPQLIKRGIWFGVCNIGAHCFVKQNNVLRH